MTRSSWTRAPGQAPWVLGHRGTKAAGPENTLQSFEAALKEGAAGVELDVRPTRDGELVVFHDPQLTRLTRGERTEVVARLSWSELSTLRLDGEPLPRLVDVLSWSRQNGARLNIEIKADVPSPRALARQVAELLTREREDPERLLLSSFNVPIVALLARALDHFAVGWLVHQRQYLLRYTPGWRLLGASALHLQHELVTPRIAARRHAQGALVNTWTVNDPTEARRLSDLGVDTIITDTPKTILSAFAARG